MFDLVIRGGRVVNGTGAAAFGGDIGVTGDRITAIGDLSMAEARDTLDAAGLVVAPGFIDIHSHSDFTLLIDPRGHSQVYQGVTTELVGNCGHGCAPLGPNVEAFTGNIYGYQDVLPIDWTTMEGYLARMEEAAPAVNVATLVPNGNLRLAVVDDVRRPANGEETAGMARLLEQGLDAGAFGFSTGLEYPAEREASEEELIELCRVTARSGGLYATHERNRELLAIEAVEEGLRAAAATGVRLQLSHILPRRGGPADSLERCIELVEAAHGRGRRRPGRRYGCYGWRGGWRQQRGPGQRGGEAPEYYVQRILEGGLHGDRVAVHHHHSLQLREAGGLGLEVDRFYVQE